MSAASKKGSLSEPIDLVSPDDIDLDRHAVIEASAGTGKTYTVEQLVKRLVCERGIPLDQILIVTFTEKATGELKERVRIALEEAAAKNPGRAELLQQSLDAYDEAPVFTIHGFCQKILRDYAFENRQPFRLDVVDDAELLDTRLREVQRRVWPRLYGKELGALLELSGYPALDDGESTWENRVTRLARTFKPRCGDELRPAPSAHLEQQLEAAGKNAAASLAKLVKLLGPIPDNVEKHDLYQGYQKLNIYSDERKKCASNIIKPLLQMVRDVSVEPDVPVMLRWARFFDSCGADVVTGGFAPLNSPSWMKKGPNLEACPQLAKVGKVLADLATQLDWQNLQGQLATACIAQLQEDLQQFKQQNGQISFDDMLVRLDDALDPKENPAADLLLAALRKRFRYALVDEFQDTDSVQWRIFRRIFVEGTDTHRLMIIGDPKQAIYGFRGADVHTYLAARAALCAGKSGYYSLPTNWRSHPDLLTALNGVFKDGDWFPDASITYRPVQAPKPGRAKLYHDRTGRAPLTLVDLPGATAGGTAHQQFAKFVATEIEHLLAKDADGKSKLVFQRRGEAESLHAGHICVLVRTKRDSYYIEKYLRKKQIPCAFYKKPGLWQSDEAKHLAYLLKVIAEPDDFRAFRRALLTRFFHIRQGDAYGPIPLAELKRYDELSPSHPIRQQLAQWRDWAERRQWPRLFESILHDTGVLQDESREDNGRRRVANHRQLLQTLLESAVDRNLDIRDLIELVHRLRTESESGGGDDEDLHRLESEKPTVQIITIHKAKGLEFPVVFIAGGFTAGMTNSYYKFHEGEKVVYDLTEAEENEAASQAEEEAENRRLFYVALTRPMYKLYLPRFGEGKKPGPVGKLLFPALEKSQPHVKWPHACRCLSFDGTSAVDLGTKPHQPQLDPLPKQSPSAVAESAVEVKELFPPAVEFRDRGVQLMSFTSLSSRVVTPTVPRFRDEDLRSDDEGMVTPRVAATGLPYGNVTGTFLHEILEQLDYTRAAGANTAEAFLADPAVSGLLDRQIRAHFPAVLDTTTLQAYRTDAARLVWQTLRTPLAGGPLSGVEQSDRLHELQFYYPMDAAPQKPIEIADIKVCRGNYLFGVIDLVFRRGETYFLLDFKSNVIDAGYGKPQIEQSMKEHRYDLQYQLYTLALVRWLKQSFGDRFDFGKQFGGVYYLYLRGLNGTDEGVFHYQPSSDDVLAYEKKIAALLKAGGAA